MCCLVSVSPLHCSPDDPDELLPGSSLPGRHLDGPADPRAGDRLEPHQSSLLGRPGGLQGCQVPTGQTWGDYGILYNLFLFTITSCHKNHQNIFKFLQTLLCHRVWLFSPQMLGPYLSSFLLCVTSLDRYRAICKPFKHKLSEVRKTLKENLFLTKYF